MKDIEYDVIIKQVPTVYIVIDGEEYELNEMCYAINDMLDTNEDDSYGDYSYRDYDLSVDEKYYKYLIKIGLVKNFTGPRQANCFCAAKGARQLLEEFQERLWEDYDKFKGD